MGRSAQVMEGTGESSLLDSRQEGRVHGIRHLELGHVLTREEVDVGVVVEIQQHNAEDLSKIQPRDHLLESLLAGPRRVCINLLVVFGEREHHVLVVKGAPFTVYSHGRIWWQVHVGKLGNRSALLNVSCVATGAEDAANLHFRIRVRRGHQGARGIVDECDDLDGHVLGNHTS